jgi:predicted TIM-barrel fold metal-dependent hydrolase
VILLLVVYVSQIIDVHVHPPLDAEDKGVNPRIVGEKLLEWANGNGISRVVVLPIAPYISNDYIYKIVEVDPKILIGFASTVPNPYDKAVKELKRAILDLDLKGLKLHPSLQGFCLRNPHVWKVLHVAGELSIPVVIHALWIDESTLYFKSPYTPWINTLEDYALLPYVAPEVKLIYAHMGGLLYFKEFLGIATHKNVYLDVSYSIITISREIGMERLAEYIKLLGAEKFLFGSDTILGCTPEELGAKMQINLIKRLPLNEEERERMLHKNAENIIKISQKG